MKKKVADLTAEADVGKVGTARSLLGGFVGKEKAKFPQGASKYPGITGTSNAPGRSKKKIKMKTSRPETRPFQRPWDPFGSNEMGEKVAPCTRDTKKTGGRVWGVF